MQALTSWLMKFRFAVLCFFVFGVMCLHTRNGQWFGDFWEHSAVVRELATHILHPSHPQLLLDAPHAFYSPYTVMVALLARALHWDALGALSIMGLVNLGLLFFGLRLFVFSIVPKHRSATAFYTLLLTLFWWGSSAWWGGFSGFFHIGNIGFVLPYPSTFATAITLAAIGMNRRRIETKRQICLVPIFLIAVIVLISHPIAFLFLIVGVVSQSCAERHSVPSQVILTGIILGLAFLVATYWPYFPVLNLLMGESAVYHFSNRAMYHQVTTRIWPALIGVPLVIATIKSNRRHPLVLMLVLLVGIYGYGAVSDRYSYGRVLSYIVLLLHIIMAEHVSMLESTLQEVHGSSGFRRLIVCATVTVMAVILSFKPLKITLWEALRERSPTYKNYLFLSRFTGQYEVVLGDIIASWMVPTFGGKIVAAAHPLAFVPDHDARRRDLDRFFNRATGLEERQQIIQKYKANYLLLRKSKGQHLQRPFMPQGQIVFENESFVLISLKSSREKNPSHQPGSGENGESPSRPPSLGRG